MKDDKRKNGGCLVGLFLMLLGLVLFGVALGIISPIALLFYLGAINTLAGVLTLAVWVHENS